MKCEHEWTRPTNFHREHVRLGHQTKVFFLRCLKCRQDAFQRPGSRVVFTWCKESEGWEP